MVNPDDKTTPLPQEPSKEQLLEAILNTDNIIGKYVLLQKIGQGGIAEVFKAWQVDLKRFVAVKKLKVQSQDEAKRFTREAQIAAKLIHPNIVQVYDMLTDKGTNYIVMQYIDGKSLAQIKLPRQETLKIMQKICNALEYAHERGIVHRDIKPGNIMVDKQGECYLTDFGLARHIMVDSSISQSGYAIGTPWFMSPEQALGKPKEIDHQSDVFSVGSTLYKLITGKPPFDSAEVYGVLKSVVEDDTTPPRTLDKTIDKDLEAIILKAMEKDKTTRYQSAKEMGDDIGRYLTGEPVKAHRTGVIYRTRRMIRRHKLLASVISISAIILLVLTYFGIAKLIQERQERLRSEEELKQKAQEREKMLMELSSLWANVVIARQGWYQIQKDPLETRRKIEQVLEEVSKFIKKYPDQPVAYYVRARGKLYLDELEQAEEDLKKAVELEPEFAPGWALLGRVKLEQYEKLLWGDPITEAERLERARPLLAEAEKAFEKGWREGQELASIQKWGLRKTEEDEVAETLARALWVYHVEKDISQARKILADANKRSESEEYYYLLATFEESVENNIQWLNKAIHIMPYYADAYVNRGVAKGNLGDYRGEIEDYTEAIRINPKDAEAYYNRGNAKYSLGDYRGAIDDCTEAIRINPKHAKAYGNRGVAKEKLGDYRGAIDDYTEAIRINPQLAEAYFGRGLAREILASVQTNEAENLLRLAADDLKKALELAGKDAPFRTITEEALKRVTEKLSNLKGEF